MYFWKNTQVCLSLFIINDRKRRQWGNFFNYTNLIFQQNHHDLFYSSPFFSSPLRNILTSGLILESYPEYVKWKYIYLYLFLWDRKLL